MRILVLFLVMTSISIFSQENSTINLKLESYKHLDSITNKSKIYNIKILEGSGLISNNDNVVVGNTNSEIQFLKSSDNKIAKISELQTQIYNEKHSNPSQTLIYNISVYYDKYGKPDIAKINRKELLKDKIEKEENELFDLSNINFNSNDLSFNLIKIRRLISFGLYN